MCRNQREEIRQQGFTLIELMVSMAVGLMILLGMMMMFTSDAKVSSTLASRTERLGDLYLVSQIMQSELRNAQSGSIGWVGNVLSYTNADGLPSKFEFQRTNKDRLYWQRPGFIKFEEVIRDLKPSSGPLGGMEVNGVGDVWTITLRSRYQNEGRIDKELEMSFKAWPRN